MKIEDLKNTKIYLHSVEDRLQFKNKLENLEIRWNFSPDADPVRHDIPFIYIDEDLELYMDFKESFEWFCANKSRQIFLDDVLAIEEPKEKCKFKPFDKVLVVNNSNIWVPRFFSRYDGKDTHRFETTNGSCYKTCIPYEGNEHLVGKLKINDYTRIHR